MTLPKKHWQPRRPVYRSGVVFAKSLVTLTALLSVASLSASPPVQETEKGSTSTHERVAPAEVLPPAAEEYKNKPPGPAVRESSTTVQFLNRNGEKAGEKHFGASTGQKRSQGATTAQRTVTVLAVADEEYAAAHSDWQSLIHNIVENADDAFGRDHSIDFQVTAIGSWQSDGGDSGAILADLSQDWGGRDYDFVTGFTKDANFTAGGIAYVYSSAPAGSAFSVNLDQGSTATWHAAQHEFSHNLGLGHDPRGSGIECIMNYDYAYQVDYWHPEHDAQIEANEHWY